MSRRRLILASASPARLGLLRQAGFAPEVMVSGVDERSVRSANTEELVRELATLKARAVLEHGDLGDALIVGCDSLFEMDGRHWGKPGSAAEAMARIRAMSGRSGLLHTGHCVIDGDTGRCLSEVRTTTVNFAAMSDAEIDCYVATGEPLEVAGAFTLDGRAAVFVESIEGDPSNVIGLSLPLLREMLATLDIEVTTLWA